MPAFKQEELSVKLFRDLPANPHGQRDLVVGLADTLHGLSVAHLLVDIPQVANGIAAEKPSTVIGPRDDDGPGIESLEDPRRPVRVVWNGQGVHKAGAIDDALQLAGELTTLERPDRRR